jgi:hypothetical protein
MMEADELLEVPVLGGLVKVGGVVHMHSFAHVGALSQLPAQLPFVCL